jgi:hypothetical protein
LLAYLDALCAALLARDTEEIDRLGRHPLARALPRTVREEVLAIRRVGHGSLRAPIETLRHYHRTAHLFGIARDPASAGDQIELPLSASGGA